MVMRVRNLLAGVVAATLLAGSFMIADPASAQRPDRRPEGPGRPALATQPPAQVVQQQRGPRIAVQPSQPPRVQQPVRRSGGGGNGGRNVALGIGAAVIGGILLNEAARAERRSSRRVVIEEEQYEDADDRRQRCDDDFRSFDWDNGTIRNRYGNRVRCPYLRDRD